MTFFEWMINKYLGEDTPEGDLAGDMYQDQAYIPKEADAESEDSYMIVMDYLQSRGACPECIDVAKRCWCTFIEQEVQLCASQ